MRVTNWINYSVCAVVVVFLLAGSAAGVTLSNPNATVKIDPLSDAGVHSWVIGAATTKDYLEKQWWYYRVGNAGPQQSIDTIGAPAIQYPSATSVEFTYTQTDFELVLRYDLADTALPGSGASDLSGTVQINNLTASPLEFNLFHYADFNISGAPGADSVVVADWSDSWFGVLDLRASQTFGSEKHDVFDTGMFGAPAPNALIGTAVEAGTPASILNSLNNVNGYNLSGNTSAGPGDVAYAFQYTMGLDAEDGTATIGFDNQMALLPVPEPVTAMLMAFGLLVLLRRRR